MQAGGNDRNSVFFAAKKSTQFEALDAIFELPRQKKC